MKQLARDLGRIFTPKKTRPSESYGVRKAREWARPVAAEYGIEIERLSDGGFNVWAPRAIADDMDPYAGDHFAEGWIEVRDMVQTYADMLGASIGVNHDAD